MRISSSVINDLATSSMSNAYARYGSIIQKIASNKNFTTVSEDVPNAINLIRVKNQISELGNYQDNIQHAINEMNLAYKTLDDVTDELTQINSLIVNASNATTSKDSAKAIGAEIKQRVETITDLMNTKYLDNYIFSGTYIDKMTYTKDADGNIVYNGSSEKAGGRNLMISPNSKFTYNFTGEEIFGKQDGVNDFFAQMKDLDELLNYDGEDDLDYEGIRSKLNTLNTAINSVSRKNGVISAKVSKLLAAQNINTDTINNLTEKRTNIEEVDIVKAASDLANAQTGLQASYRLGTSVLGSVSLLDYI